MPSGLSQRAGHPASQLHLLHGSLFDIKCTSFDCTHVEENFTDPIVPALAIPKEGSQPNPSSSDKTGAEATSALYGSMKQANTERKALKDLDISDDRVEIPQIPVQELPQCPKCGGGLLRPGVVWFGEALPEKTMDAVDAWMGNPEKVDLILVIGTSARVYPAASYVEIARDKGARVAVINMDKADTPGGRNGLTKRDWFFQGDAGSIVPEILKTVIGDISCTSTEQSMATATP